MIRHEEPVADRARLFCLDPVGGVHFHAARVVRIPYVDEADGRPVHGVFCGLHNGADGS